MSRAIPLTSFQVGEVQGLLDVCVDEQTISGERRPWGRIDYTGSRPQLVVTDAVDAVDDLRYRAGYLIDESRMGSSSGASAARSLRTLADTIEKEQPSNA